MPRIFFLSCCAFLIACSAPPRYSGNPILPGWYADPEVSRFGDRYWIFPTYSARFPEQVFFDAFSSPDLVTWTKHPRILDTAAVSWAQEAMWAPCAIERQGRYYLFFAANDIQRPESPWWQPGDDSAEVGGIGVAVAEQPEGPYRDLIGQPLVGEVYHGAQPIDQFVFEASDGETYLIYGGWGHCNLARLSDSLTSLLPFSGGEKVKEITPPGYVEGPVMFERQGRTYFMWSEGNWTQANYRVAYGIAGSPLGPFERLGTVLQADTSLATGAGHHSVLHLPGLNEWYIVYHRRPIPNEDRDHRVVCIERMYFDEKGHILPISLSRQGVPARPLAPGNSQFSATKNTKRFH